MNSHFNFFRNIIATIVRKIRVLVRNYIWSGKEDQVTRAKVAWPILKP